MSPLAAVRLGNWVKFGDGTVVDELDGDEAVTHVVVVARDVKQARGVAADLRCQVSSRRRVPRIVKGEWVKDCWRESTLVDEEAYVVL